MKLSRKAGLIAGGVSWRKHNCSPYQVMWYTYSETGWVSGGSTTVDSSNYVGYPDYEIVGDGSSPYKYATVGDEIVISVKSPGTIYSVFGDSVHRTTINEYSVMTIIHQTLTSTPNVETRYRIGEFLGSVRTPREKHPDEKKGYTYVDTYGEYIIMRDKGGTYYAYTLTTPKEDTPSSTYSARITDGDLVVTGDGNAIILDNVLVVTGDASASVENDTLYVRQVDA